MSCPLSQENPSKEHLNDCLQDIQNLTLDCSLVFTKNGTSKTFAIEYSQAKNIQIYIPLFYGISEVKQSMHNSSFVILRQRKKRKWSQARIIFYNNTTATFNLLLESGDIEKNPGPQNNCNKHQKALRCIECEKPVARNHKRCQCTICFDMVHAKCTRILNVKSINSQAPVKWTCNKCTLSLLPFSSQGGILPDDDPDDNVPQADVDYNSFTSDQLRSVLNQHPKHLKIMHLTFNTQSMVSTFNEFLLTVSHYPFDVVTLSETWLKDNPYLLEYVSIPGYISVFRNRDVIRGGGVGAYLRESINFKRREDIEKLQPEFEHLWLEIPGRNKHSKVLVGVIYRSTRILSTQDWLERLESLLGFINATWDGLLVLTGDINIDMLSQENHITKDYQSLLDMFDLKQMIDKPTRVTRTSRTLIDHIVTNCPSRVTTTGIVPCSIVSDHDGVYACINAKVSRFKPRYKYIRDTKTFDSDAFIKDFADIPFAVAEAVDDPDDQLNIINTLIKECLERHCPLRRTRVTRPPAPWMRTPVIDNLKHQRDKLRDQARTTNSTESWNVY